LQTAVARRDGGVTVGHAHHGFDKVALLVAHGVIHGSVGGAGFAFGDVGRAAVDFDGGGGHGSSLCKGKNG